MATTTKRAGAKKRATSTSTRSTKKTVKKPAKRNTVSKAKKANEAVTATVSASKKESVKVTTSSEKKARGDGRFRNLKIWNYAMAALHALQGIAVVVLSQDRLLPVSTDYLTIDPLSPADSPSLVSATRHLFDVNVAYIVAAFFFMSAIAHLSIATWYRRKYEANLQNGINKARWIEYSFSASTMIVAIAMIAGVYDLSTLAMMFGLTAVMNLCGLVMEKANSGREKIDWTSYIVGCIAGVIPWLVYALYVYGSEVYGQSGPPTFVYFILVSIFLFFNIFALNMWLQYKKKGRWADYLYGEKAYIVLSLVAKSALAWQVFAGTLRP